MKKFTRIFLIGPMGAGKTSVGSQLATLFNYKFVDADFLIEQKHSMSVYQHFKSFGEEHFRQQESLLLAEATGYNNTVFATGGGCILHAANRQLLYERGFICYLTVSLENQLHRLSDVQNRPLLPPAHDQRQHYLRITSLIRSPLYEAIANFKIATDDKPITTVAIEIFNAINEMKCK